MDTKILMTKGRRVVFAAVANLLGLGMAALGAEFVVRWRVEHGLAAAWRSFSNAATPFSDLQTHNEIVADPELGYRFNPAQGGINSLGLRGPEIPPQKAPGVPRLIVLGDSVAADPDGFVTMVQDRVQGGAEVINAAIPGYTTWQERRLLERDLLATRPDLVILQYCVNDNHKFLHRFDVEEHMLITEEARRVLLPPGGGPLAWLARRSYLAFRLRLALLELRHAAAAYPWEDQPDVAPAWQDTSWTDFEEHLRAMQRVARLAVVMAPYRPQLDERLLARDAAYVLKPQRKMSEICQRLGVPLLDLYPVLAARGRSDLYVDNTHFSPEGHRVVAEALVEFLVRRQLLSKKEQGA